LMPSAIDEAIAALTSQRLLHFLSRQRWFGAKGEVPTSAAVTDWMFLPAADVPLAVTRIRVETTRGSVLYQLPIAVRETTPLGMPASAMLATIDARQVYDAVYDPQFHATLARGIATGLEAIASSGRRWVVEGSSEMRELSDATNRARLLGVEQSNSSIV